MSGRCRVIAVMETRLAWKKTPRNLREEPDRGRKLKTGINQRVTGTDDE